MGHTNADTLRKAYDAFSRGDLDGIPFADDVVFHIPGKSPMAGDYRGKAAVFGFLGQVMERTGGSFRLEVHDIAASDDHAVGLTVHSGQRGGKAGGYNSVHVWHVKNGRLAEFFEFPDQPAFDDFWA
ncbi:MAG: nuclear transport factor 2 family protein [Dehalococcoidia bacterium]|nr:nuclear transport factor 2 family protein [Dehalococcoidia bacterium]